MVGSSNTDMVVKAARLPGPGETVTGGEFFTAPGGKGANQAVAAARAGAEVTLVARLGDDHFGKSALQNFKREGIDTSFVTVDREAPSGIAIIMVDKEGENLIAVAPGANAQLSAEDVEKARRAIQNSDVLLLQLEIRLETVSAALDLAHRGGVQVLLNPGPAPSKPLPAELLEKVSIIIPNCSEAGAQTGIKVTDADSQLKACKQLKEMGSAKVVLTLGAEGAMVFDVTAELVPAFKVDAIDAVGAGDAFCGNLAVALAEGMKLKQAVRFASGAAALACTKLGAQPSLPTRCETEEFLSSPVG